MKKYYTVGEISKMFGISKDTVRLYDKIGILSPVKSDANHYRYYTREDMIFFCHVCTLKKLGLPLKLIKKLLYESDLSTNVINMSVQEDAINDKIAELIRLKQMLSDYKNTLNEAANSINVIKICESPAIIYKYIDIENGKSINNAFDSFNRLTNRQVPSFTFIMDKEFIFRSEKEIPKTHWLNYIRNAISIKDEKGLREKSGFKEGKFMVMEPQPCVSAVVKSGGIDQYQSFLEVEDYIKEKGLEITSDYFIRALSLSRCSEYSCDYYEILIPISY
jgi:DNA-binding transcriptional MerR regulator